MYRYKIMMFDFNSPEAIIVELERENTPAQMININDRIYFKNGDNPERHIPYCRIYQILSEWYASERKEILIFDNTTNGEIIEERNVTVFTLNEFEIGKGKQC